jgi:maleylacetate reductase
MSNPGNPLLAGTYRSSMMERVHWGRPAAEVLSEELALGQATRVLIVTNRSLRESPQLTGLVDSLSTRLAGVYSGVTAHSPRECAIEGAAQARACEADLLVAVGGGSVIDATKGILLCLRHGYTTPQQMEPHANDRSADVSQRPSDADQWLRMIAVPTTLSGAEFAASAGLSDPERGLKHAFVGPMQMPKVVILDPAMTLATPLDLLRATGMKAVDHAVERMTSSTANAYSDAVSEVALRMLHEGLRGLDPAPDDLELRSRLQFGMFMSLRGSAAGVAVNVSHAIGHVLGAHAGVPHGHTTGVVLPSVLAWNRAETRQAQQRVAAALGQADGDAAAAVRELVRSLRLPTRLRDVGVLRDDLPAIAAKTMHEALLRNSRKPVASPADVQEILELAW